MWDNSALECMQLQGIGKQTSQLLAAAKLSRLRQLEAADPRKIEAVTQRHYPFGEQQNCRTILLEGVVSLAKEWQLSRHGVA